MLKSFDPKSCKAISEEILAALAPIAKRHGLIFERGRGKYSATDFTLPVIAKITNGGTADDVLRRDFAKSCMLYDLKPSDFGRTFTQKGEKFRIVGFDNRKPKFCVLAERVSDGVSFGYADTVLKRLDK